MELAKAGMRGVMVYAIRKLWDQRHTSPEAHKTMRDQVAALRALGPGPYLPIPGEPPHPFDSVKRFAIQKGVGQKPSGGTAFSSAADRRCKACGRTRQNHNVRHMFV